MRFWRRIGLVAVLVGAALSPLHCYGLREDELRCEEAVARLLDCCPGFDPQGIDCRYYVACNNTHHPEIPIVEARCIAARSCEEVTQATMCERTQNNQHPACP